MAVGTLPAPTATASTGTVRPMTQPASQRRAMRLDLRERRAALSGADQGAASMAVMARLARMPLLREAAIISGYRAVRGEIDIDAALILLCESGRTITVPRVVGDHLEFVTWDPEGDATTGSFGIQEPAAGDPVPLHRHDVVLAPLVAFDERGNRLGQGGGFYDRALAGAGSQRPIVIGVAHSFQQVGLVPAEAWDIPLDAVVTEDCVLEFRPGALDPPTH